MTNDEDGRFAAVLSRPELPDSREKPIKRRVAHRCTVAPMSGRLAPILVKLSGVEQTIVQMIHFQIWQMFTVILNPFKYTWRRLVMSVDW